MSNPVFLVGMGIILTGLVVLLVFGGDGTVVGMEADGFGHLVRMAALLVLVSAGLVAGRHRANARLWHVAVWLAILFVLVVGYMEYQDYRYPAPEPVGLTAV